MEAELVLGAWWLLWTGLLTWLLVTGHRVSDDHGLDARGASKLERLREWLDYTPHLDAGDADSLPGLVVSLVLGLLAAILFALAAWFLVELAIPAIALVAYVVIRGMLARVANDHHGCEGNLARALGWGALWATIYTAPLALAVWLAHRLAGGRL